MLSNALIKSLNTRYSLYDHNLKIQNDGLLISSNTILQGDVTSMTLLNVNKMIVDNSVNINGKTNINSSLNVSDNVCISGNTNIYGNLNIAGAINIITTNSKLITYDHILITAGSAIKTVLEINKTGDASIFKVTDNELGKLFEIDNHGNVMITADVNINGKLTMNNLNYSFLEIADTPLTTTTLTEHEHSYIYWDILSKKIKNHNLVDLETSHKFKVNKTGIYSINTTFNYILSNSSTRATITSFISRNAGLSSSQEITNSDIGFNLLNATTNVLTIPSNNVTISNTIYLEKDEYICLGCYVHTIKNGNVSLGPLSRLQFTYLKN